MIETYRLDEKTLPALPDPHDCVIKSITIDESFIVFRFENNIVSHDSISYFRPESDCLIIRYHLCDPCFFTYYQIKHTTVIGKRFGKHGYYEVENEFLLRPSKFDLEFLYQNISYNSIIIKLWRRRGIIIDASVDYIEYEWINKAKMDD